MRRAPPASIIIVSPRDEPRDAAVNDENLDEREHERQRDNGQAPLTTSRTPTSSALPRTPLATLQSNLLKPLRSPTLDRLRGIKSSRSPRPPIPPPSPPHFPIAPTNVLPSTPSSFSMFFGSTSRLFATYVSKTKSHFTRVPILGIITGAEDAIVPIPDPLDQATVSMAPIRRILPRFKEIYDREPEFKPALVDLWMTLEVLETKMDLFYRGLDSEQTTRPSAGAADQRVPEPSRFVNEVYDIISRLTDSTCDTPLLFDDIPSIISEINDLTSSIEGDIILYSDLCTDNEIPVYEEEENEDEEKDEGGGGGDWWPSLVDIASEEPLELISIKSNLANRLNGFYQNGCGLQGCALDEGSPQLFSHSLLMGF